MRLTGVSPANCKPALIRNSGVGVWAVICSGQFVVEGCSALWAWRARILLPETSHALAGPRVNWTTLVVVLTL